MRWTSESRERGIHLLALKLSSSLFLLQFCALVVAKGQRPRDLSHTQLTTAFLAYSCWAIRLARLPLHGNIELAISSGSEPQ